jgi:cyclopropane fatty-acyl-phospholipid synthase-like methyltransferase
MPDTPIAYFDEMYTDPDPWGYESSWYEHRKYALTLAALTRDRYPHALEIGCSIGVLTDQLADRCDRLLAIDLHRGALERARQRVATRSHVRLARLQVPRQWPDGTFDLIVISEVAYYLEPARHHRLVDKVVDSIADDGEVVLVHWRGETDYPQTGDEAHRRWLDDQRFTSVAAYREAAFRLDVLARRST